MNAPAERPAVVARYRMRHSRTGRMRFSSHRDFQRAFERAVRRAGIPMGFSHGFNPRPRISYANAAATGVASLAEYLEFGVTEPIDVQVATRALDESLPAGLDVVEIVPARIPDFVVSLQASHYRIALAGVPPTELAAAVALLVARDEVIVERMMKAGIRQLDIGAALVRAQAAPASEDGCAILDVVVRQDTTVVRPDDVLAALRQVADLDASSLSTRMAQGPLAALAQTGPIDACIDDPFAADRDEGDVATRRLAWPPEGAHTPSSARRT